jgi:hypothetical protein
MDDIYKYRHLTEAKREITNLQRGKVRKHQGRIFDGGIEIELLKRMMLFRNK